MKYLVKNKTTGEETLCEKVEVDGWLYYIAGEAIEGDYGYLNFQGGEIEIIGKYFADDWLKVIATNNKSLDLPQVVDELEELIDKLETPKGLSVLTYDEGFKEGYKTAKETFEYTKEDMVEFALWYQKENTENKAEFYFGFSDMDMLNIWQEQRIKTIIVE